jgi:hypothetical protein
MMPRFFLLAAILLTGALLRGDQPDPFEILRRVDAAYHALDTYQSAGRVVVDIKHEGRPIRLETMFSIRLQKPRSYLITWESQLPVQQSGAVWSSGQQPYLFMSGVGAYSKLPDDEIALAAATGISGGVANTIPSLFFETEHNHSTPFDRLIDPRLEGVEVVHGIPCYRISSPSELSRQETFWISVDGYLMVKYARALEVAGGKTAIPVWTDKELDRSLEAMGLELTEENRTRSRARMLEAAEQMERTQLTGTTTELHLTISHPVFGPADFEFDLPEGILEKRSLFD